MPSERFSHDIKTGVVLHEKPKRRKTEKHSPINNMTQTFNEMSMEWNNEKIVWKLNNQLINKVDLKKFSFGDQNIEQMFNENFRIIMAISLREEFYYSSNFNLKSLHKPYLYVDYIRVYKWNETENNTRNNTQDNTQNNTQNNTENKTENNTQNNIQNNTQKNTQDYIELLNDGRNTIIPVIIPVSLVIFVVILIIIAIVYWKLKMNRKINPSTYHAVYVNVN
jgi:hypothetical protein